MPNWCYNSARLYNEDKSKIDDLETTLSDEKAEVCQHLCPNPAGEWDYGWSVENWGTKWDFSPHDWERLDDNTISINFDTAWSPPIALYEYLESNGWSVQALYHEPGLCFAGRFEDGYDDYYELDLTDREAVEILPTEILEFSNALEDLDNYEQEQFEESIADLERTDWYPVATNPDKVGRYEVMRKDWSFVQWSDWDGKEWQHEDVSSWRGLVNNPEEWDPVAELDKIVNP